MIKDINDRLVEGESDLKVICYDLFFVHIKMSHYWFNKQELLQKIKERYHNCGGKKKLLSIISQIKIL